MSLPQPMVRLARAVDPRVVDVGLAVALTVWALAKSGVLRDASRHEHRAKASADRADRLEGPDAPPDRGLAGMGDRAAMYGSTLQAGPSLDRGYSVNAHIPLEAIRA